MKKINLYRCPVCFLSDKCKRDGYPKRAKCTDYRYKKGAAAWLFDEECPLCEGPGMLMQDKFGVICVIHSCAFDQNYEEGL